MAVVIDDRSKKGLRTIPIPNGKDVSSWEYIAHHMTICMGAKPAYSGLVGKRAVLMADAIALTDKVVAVHIGENFLIGSTNEVPCDNAFRHVTLFVNRGGGGKPVDSNDIQLNEWVKLPVAVPLAGVVQIVG